MPSSAHAQLVPILRWLFGSNLLEREEVVRKARHMLLDTIGCALAGLEAPVLQAQRQLLHGDQPGGFFTAPQPAGVSTGAASELLATAAVWDEACEGLARAHGRPGVGVIAACLPLAVLQNRSLGELLSALVTGYEVGARMGEWLRIRPGMHVDAGWPALGIAAAVARLQGRSADEALAAIEIAACHVPFGLYAPVRMPATPISRTQARSGCRPRAPQPVASMRHMTRSAITPASPWVWILRPRAWRLPVSS